MSKSFKRLLSSVLAFVMAVTCLTVVNVGSVFAENTAVNFYVADYSKYSPEVTISSTSENKNTCEAALANSSTLYTISSDNSAYSLLYRNKSNGDKLTGTGSTTATDTLGMTGKSVVTDSTSTRNVEYFGIKNVPANAKINVTAYCKSGNEDTLSYVVGSDPYTSTYTSSSVQSASSTKTSTEESTLTITNSNAINDIYFGFTTKPQNIKAITMTIPGTTTSDTYSISGTVTGSDATSGLVGASVEAKGSDGETYPATTTTGGAYTIKDIPSTTTITSITFSMDGYTAQTKSDKTYSSTSTAVDSVQLEKTTTPSQDGCVTLDKTYSFGTNYSDFNTATASSKTDFTYENITFANVSQIDSDHVRIANDSTDSTKSGTVSFKTSAKFVLTATLAESSGAKLVISSDGGTTYNALDSGTEYTFAAGSYIITSASTSKARLASLKFATAAETVDSYTINGTITNSGTISTISATASGDDNNSYNVDFDSDNNKSFTISYVPSSVSIDELIITAEGYEKYTHSAAISSNGTASVDVSVTLTEKATSYSITGTILAADTGKGLAGATVTASDGTTTYPTSDTVTTNANGEYTISGIPVGTTITSLDVTAPDGYKSQTGISVSLSSSANQADDITLNKSASSATTGETLVWVPECDLTFLGSSINTVTVENANSGYDTEFENTALGSISDDKYIVVNADDTIIPTQSGTLKLYMTTNDTTSQKNVVFTVTDSSDNKLDDATATGTVPPRKTAGGGTQVTDGQPVEMTVTAGNKYTFPSGTRYLFRAELTPTGTSGGDTDTTYSATITVKYNTTGITGATVKASDGTTTYTAAEGSDGQYIISGIPSDKTLSTVSVTKSGYKTASETVAITSTNKTATVELTKSTSATSIPVKVIKHDSGTTIKADVYVNGKLKASDVELTIGSENDLVSLANISAEAGDTIMLSFDKSPASHVTNWSSEFKSGKKGVYTLTYTLGSTTPSFEYWSEMTVQDLAENTTTASYGTYGFGKFKHTKTNGQLESIATIKGYQYSLADVGAGNYDKDGNNTGGIEDARVLLNKSGGSVTFNVDIPDGDGKALVSIDVSGGSTSNPNEVRVTAVDSNGNSVLYTSGDSTTAVAYKDGSNTKSGDTDTKLQVYVGDGATVKITGLASGYSVLKSVRIFSINNITEQTQLISLGTGATARTGDYKDLVSKYTTDQIADTDNVYILVGSVTDASGDVSSSEFESSITSVGFDAINASLVDAATDTSKTGNPDTLITSNDAITTDSFTEIPATTIYKGIFNQNGYSSDNDVAGTDYSDYTSVANTTGGYKTGYFAYLIAVPTGVKYYAYPYTMYSDATAKAYNANNTGVVTIGE